jgi:hypothetical protein
VLIAKAGFAMQAEFDNLVRFKQADNQIDAGSFPATHLVGNPVPRAWPWHNRQPARRRSVDPMDFGWHLASSRLGP